MQQFYCNSPSQSANFCYNIGNMKAFLVGLIFLVAVGVLAGVGVLIFPLLLLLAWVLRLILCFGLVILAVWLLGKFIIWAWEKVK
jgi:hypothetical protein